MTKNDALLAALFILSAILLMILNGKKGNSKKVLEIIKRKEPVEKIILPTKKNLEIKYGKARLLIEIDNFRVRILKSSCQKKLCMKQGWISTAGSAIICLPLKLLVRIKDREETGDGDIDAETY